jgi:hypothetical protein
VVSEGKNERKRKESATDAFSYQSSTARHGGARDKGEEETNEKSGKKRRTGSLKIPGSPWPFAEAEKISAFGLWRR